MSLKSYTDSELLSLLRQGVESGFTEIYNRYWKNLLVVAANKTGDLDEAEEIVQDLFVSLWNRRETLEITSSLNNYLAVSVKYRVIKALAKKNHRQKFAEQNLQNNILLDDSTQEWLEFEELQQQLQELVAALPKSAGLCTSSAESRVILKNRLRRNLALQRKP